MGLNQSMEVFMKKCVALLFTVVIFIATTSAFARTIDPIVSTDWLESNLGTAGLVIVDIRPTPRYNAGHIPGSLSEPWAVPFSAWITMPESGLLLEMPTEAALEESIGNLGISENSKVVVVGAPNPGEPVHFGVAGAMRVAMTLVYAGVDDVAVLDGGYPKWVQDDGATSTDATVAEPVDYDGCFDSELIATIDDVADAGFSTTLVDARDADVYFGATVEPYALAAGHIPGATSLPGPFAFDVAEDVVTLKPTAVLADMAKGVVRTNWPFWVPVEYKDVIIYCGVGGYGAIWTYLLQEVLGYHRVRLYDGSAQEWVNSLYPMNAYVWEW
jgi:thiosulfate/3-mercaptopyruvate sulfurtransferase